MAAKKTKNYGMLGGMLDGSKHKELAANPADYMRRLAQHPWCAPIMARRETAAIGNYIESQN